MVRGIGRWQRDDWQLTDSQRLIVALTLSGAIFVGAMALGMQSLLLLLFALFMAVATGLGVFLLGLRHHSRRPLRGTAHVITVTPPPIGQIVGRCDMRLLLNLPNGTSMMVKHRDSLTPVMKWPRVGSILPIEVDPHSSRQLKVHWDSAEAHYNRASNSAGEPTAANVEPPVPFFTDYAVTPGQTDGDGDGDGDDVIIAEPEPRADVDLYIPAARIIGARIDFDDANTDGADPPEVVKALPPDPEFIDWDLSDWDSVEASSSTSSPTDSDHAEPAPSEPVSAEPEPSEPPLPMRNIPHQRRPEPDDDPAVSADTPAMGIMLIVSDLAQSLRFYRDLLDFAVADEISGSAVLTYGGGRILLRQVTDMSPVDRRVVHLHVQVSDVESSYQDLRGKGVEFVHRPRMMNRGDRLELWAATFRDPDGHAIALTQWRDRGSVSSERG